MKFLYHIGVSALLALPETVVAQAPAKPVDPPCVEGAYVKVVEGTEPFNIARACEAYRDMVTYHVPNHLKVPNVFFHLVSVMDHELCTQHDYDSWLRGIVLACYDRRQSGTEIWVSEDDPKNYLGPMLDGLDYANQSYLTRMDAARIIAPVLAELKHPDLRLRTHATLNAKELGKGQ